MRPTITNAFTVVGSSRGQDTLGTTPNAADASGSNPATPPTGASSPPASASAGPTNATPSKPKARAKRGSAYPNQRNRMRGKPQPDAAPGNSSGANVPAGETSTTLAPMQVDLRETDFGTSLELNPMQAIDAVHALLRSCPASAQFLVSMEQAAWRDGNEEAPLSTIADRIGVTAIEVISKHQLVLDASSLSALAAVCQPTRLLAIAVDGPIESGDARAMNKAIEKTRSPLTAELRAIGALEVLGDRSVVLHARNRIAPLMLVAENFRHYLAAILDRPSVNFAAPETAQVRELVGLTGALTVRPVETDVQSTSIDIGVNTSAERFTQPANVSLIYDRPSNTWHTEL